MNLSEKKKPDAQKQKLLVVDDEKQIRELIAELLEEHFDSFLASNGEEAIALAKSENPALILLDIVMPGVGGIEICDLLRKDAATRHIPIIMLSAAGNVENRTRSFNHGADDFIPKPFDADELMARIQAKLRRAGEQRLGRQKIMTSGNLVLDQTKLLATIDGNRIPLSKIEWELLSILMKKMGEAVSRKEIVKKVWKDGNGSERLIDAHMVALRRKIEGFQGVLETIYGKGYVLRSPRAD